MRSTSSRARRPYSRRVLPALWGAVGLLCACDALYAGCDRLWLAAGVYALAATGAAAMRMLLRRPTRRTP